MSREEELRKYNLLTLRDYGRKCGVKSPTSKSKEQLIKEIIEIENGDKDPTKSNLGRKPKKSFLIEKFNKCELCENYKRKDISSNEMALILEKTIKNLLSLL